MGQAVSIHDLVCENDLEEVQNPKSESESDPTPISRSNSIRSISSRSHISNTSNMSTVSTISMSDKFISYENTAIQIRSCCSVGMSPLANQINKNLSWNVSILPKVSKDFTEMNEINEINDNEYICIVFGVCEETLLEKGYKHRYYGYGYSVTYCHGYKFQSYATTFKKKESIFIKYDPHKGEIMFVQNKQVKKRKIRIDTSMDHILTIKSYDDAYDVQINNINN